MGQFTNFFFKTFNFNFRGMSIPIPYIQAAAVIVLLFILLLMMARFRRHYVDWSLKGAVFGVFFGFLLALILEGFLIIGGKTALTEVVGWKNAPKPIEVALDKGREKLIQVLGINSQIPNSYAKEGSTVQGALMTIQSLNPADLKKVKTILCQP